MVRHSAIETERAGLHAMVQTVTPYSVMVMERHRRPHCWEWAQVCHELGEAGHPRDVHHPTTMLPPPGNNDTANGRRKSPAMVAEQTCRREAAMVRPVTLMVVRRQGTWQIVCEHAAAFPRVIERSRRPVTTSIIGHHGGGKLNYILQATFGDSEPLHGVSVLYVHLRFFSCENAKEARTSIHNSTDKYDGGSEPPKCCDPLGPTLKRNGYG